MDTTSSGNQPENNSNPYNTVDQQCSANPNCDDQFSPRDLFIQKICYNPDPEVCFRNLLKLITNSKKHLRSFENCIERFVKMKFDKTLDIDIKRYEPLFKKYHQGFSRKFNYRKAKNSDLYGPDAFIWAIEHYLVDSDYKFKKQKIKSEEFGFIAYLLFMYHSDLLFYIIFYRQRGFSLIPVDIYIDGAGTERDEAGG